MKEIILHVFLLSTGMFLASNFVRAVENENSDLSTRKRELKEIADELRTAILRKNIDTILKYVVIGPDGFKSYGEARELFETMPSTRCLLFDTVCQIEYLRNNAGENNPYRVSVLDFFKAHPDLRIEIYFWPNNQDFARILYISRGAEFDRSYPHWVNDINPLKQWGKEFVQACMQYTKDGWRYRSADGGIFFCSTE
jgi:hypothetical protein